ncbi:MAG: PDZ domain-containing protein [Alphaproteobacteria bacterium]|nr:PDZ domain-containing protein [Alphaproteobacteria bacterium]
MTGPCVAPGTWVEPGTGARHAGLPPGLARHAVVLLGESHDEVAHHRWQLHAIAALHAGRPDMVLGFEMFPRRAQPVLDRWVRGELGEAQFLRDVEWTDVWGSDAGLYLPLFHFARMHRVAMLALNVDRGVSRLVAREGLAAVTGRAREGVGDPEPASPEYRTRLRSIFAEHPQAGATPDAESPAFQRFVEAQLLWDRAMAEAIAGVVRDGRRPFVAAIMGRGHVEYRHGVPHQLKALGIQNVGVALPWPADRDCVALEAGLADLVFGLDPPLEPAAPPPRLGVVISAVETGLHVNRIAPDSIAAATGLQVGDIIREAAGVVVRRPADLVAIVGRQAPGTWLPLRVRRGQEDHEWVARFPVAR